MNLSDKILEEAGLRYEDLSPEEKETYNAQFFNIKNLTIEDLKQHVIDMKNSIAIQLSDTDPQEDEYTDLILKARLKNYILLEAFLTTPEKAEKALRNAISNVKPLKGK
jgi:hypothetical protein